MSIDARKWFQSNVVYQGLGRAEFISPKGYIEGPVKIQCKSSGECSIVMSKITSFTNEEWVDPGARGFELDYLITGTRPTKLGDGMMMGIGGKIQNFCSRLEVKIRTPKGTFVSTRVTSYLPVQIMPYQSIAFYFSDAVFEVNNPDEPAYWAIPLTNFIFDFAGNRQGQREHPLQHYTPTAWIGFKFSDAVGFIEPVPNYDTVAKKLKSGSARNALTALMVGSIPQSLYSQPVSDWLPSDFFIALLSLACGTEVSSPWIELRTAQGTLVKRIHTNWGQHRFSQGLATFHGFQAPFVERLLTQTQTAELFANRELRIAIQRLVKSKLNDTGLTLEDQFSSLFRAYEGLPHEISVAKTRNVLTRQNRQRLLEVIRKAQDEIEDILKTIQVSDEDSDDSVIQKMQEKERLTRIKHRLPHTANINLSFGELVTCLANINGLGDPIVMAKHYAHDNEWTEKLTGAYRAHIMHGRFFDFHETDVDIHEVVIILSHLQDLLTRIILKMLKYDGNYSPLIGTVPDLPVDWVKPDMSAKDLGYAQEPG